jgi:H+-transporting ATPase
MLWSSATDIAVVIVLASQGILMGALPQPVIAGLLGAVVVYLFCVDYEKIAIFRRFGLSWVTP